MFCCSYRSHRFSRQLVNEIRQRTLNAAEWREYLRAYLFVGPAHANTLFALTAQPLNNY